MSRQKIRKLTPRYSIFLAGILFVFVLFFYQLYMIFFVYSDRLPRKSFTQTAKISTRGLIKDRNGILLATNVPSYSVVVNPSVMTKDTYLKILGHLSSSISSLIRFEQAKAKQAKHLIVEKNLSDLQIASLKSDNSLMREGVFIEKEYRRFYPLGEAISPVIGILDAKGQGQLGIENLLDSHLQKDDISLTIDSISQAIAYSELEDAIKNQHAKRGAVLVADVATSEIIVNAVYPSFNPNNRENLKYEYTQNIAFTEQFEPGSVIKPLLVAKYYETSSSLNKTFNIGDKTHIIGKFTIRDHHVPKTIITLTEAVKYSSNIALIKIREELGKTHTSQLFEDLGLGFKTSINFPNEKEGLIVSYWDNEANWSSLAYGYSIELTLAQILNAYQALANNGKFIGLKLVKDDKENQTETQVFEEDTSKALLAMLEQTVIDGTGKRAHIDGYRIAGKTGSARKLINKAYSDKHHRFSFVGLIPADKPRFVCLIFIDEPLLTAGSNTELSAGMVAASLFSKIMHKVALRHNVFPKN